MGKNSIFCQKMYEDYRLYRKFRCLPAGLNILPCKTCDDREVNIISHRGLFEYSPVFINKIKAVEIDKRNRPSFFYLYVKPVRKISCNIYLGHPWINPDTFFNISRIYFKKIITNIDAG